MHLACIALALNLVAADAPKAPIEVLWPQGAPGAKGTEKADRPTLTIVLPPAERASGAAVIVCPGGGYGGLADSYEGIEPAEWLAQRGIAGIMLRYRHAPRYRHPAPLEDAQRALRTVRSRAEQWHLDPAKIGIWGFSAGGHLASTTATHFDAGKPDSTDPIEKVSSRPDFAILCYPVITLQLPYAHMGSRNNLLGENADEKLVESLCNDKQVTAQTPPTFLFHTDTDVIVPPENSVLFYAALKKAKVPAEMHIYAKGPHGVGLGKGDPVVGSWPARLEDWLRGRGLVGKAK